MKLFLGQKCDVCVVSGAVSWSVSRFGATSKIMTLWTLVTHSGISVVIGARGGLYFAAFKSHEMSDAPLSPLLLPLSSSFCCPLIAALGGPPPLPLAMPLPRYQSNKIHVQTNTKSVQCLCINTKHNKVRITQSHSTSRKHVYWRSLQGLSGKCKWGRQIARPWKPPAWCKNLGHNSYTSHII